MSINLESPGRSQTQHSTISTEKVDHNKIKVTGLAERLFKSPLFWDMTLSGGVIAFAAVALSSAVPLPLLATIGVVALGIIGIFSITIIKRQQVLYEISLTYSVIRKEIDKNWRWYDEIIPAENGNGSVTLGAMPLKTKNHHNLLKDYAFLAMVQEDEMRWASLFTDPLTPEDRESLHPNVHKQISTQDFRPVTAENLMEGVEFIDKTVVSGLDVYVHCKAGRARSAAVVVCYILYMNDDLTENMKVDIDNAIRYVKERRPQTDIGKGKRREIEAFYQKYCLV